MTLTIELSESVERRLAARAAKAGKPVEVLARELIEEAVPPAKEKTWQEIVAPFAQSFEESGMTEEELDVLVKEARREIWAEQQRAKQ